ncbi:MAG: cellulase family glycosylhydrolase [Polyangia bacterium]
MRTKVVFGFIGAVGLAVLGCGGGGASTVDAAPATGGSSASGGTGPGATGGARGGTNGAGGSSGAAGSAGGAGTGATAGGGGIAGVAGGLGGTAGSGAASVGGAAGGRGGQAGLTGFVTRQGTQFIDGGKRHVVVGANFWQGMSLGSTAAGGDRARLTRELDRLQLLGVNNIRMVASAEGPDTAPYRIVPSLMPMPGVYNEQVFQGLDVFLDELAKRGMRAVMVLNNYWEWSGGFGQYVSWSDGSKIPDRIPNSNLYSSFVSYVDRFYACATCQTAYRAHINTLVNRVNTVNGRTYRDDPAIFAWQLANEPRDYPANWINDTAMFIKSLDPNHMVTVGSEGSWGGDFTTTHQSQYVDYTTCHIWVEPWGKYSATDSSASNLQSATSFATTYLQNHDTMAKQLGKPLVLEEFGLARDGWASGGKTDPASPTTNRDKYYKSLYTVVETSLAKSGNALAGDNFWAWGGEARPPSKWTGDPPHEPAGWFSVYDADTSTTAIISTHGATIKADAR